MADIQGLNQPSAANLLEQSNLESRDLKAAKETIGLEISFADRSDLKQKLHSEGSPLHPGENSSPDSCSVSRIAVVNNFNQSPITTGDQQTIVASHGELVALASGGKHPVIAFNAATTTSGSTGIDDAEMIEALKTIGTSHQSNCISTVNLSFSDPVSFAAINQLVEQSSRKLSSSVEKITPENVAEHSATIRHAVEEAATTHGESLGSIPELGRDHTEVQKYLRQTIDAANAIRNLTEQGLSVVEAAGNNGPNKISLLSIMAPEMVTVCGTDTSGKLAADNSSFHSLVDACKPMTHRFALGDGAHLYQDGTSFAAPALASEIADAHDLGFSGTKVNNLLAENRDKLVPHNNSIKK
ncbi:MAG: S8/S53 family peptidase [bacterium]|nr:S8/S53 family peptidase [bacterium]